jgi:hypothetical protein
MSDRRSHFKKTLANHLANESVRVPFCIDTHDNHQILQRLEEQLPDYECGSILYAVAEKRVK